MSSEIFKIQPIRPSDDLISLARRTTHVFGLQWLDKLVKEGQAIDLGGDGYPCRYSVAAGVLIPIINRGRLPSSSQPLAAVPVFGENYILPPHFQGKIDLYEAQISDCPDDEPLLVEAWDLS